MRLVSGFVCKTGDVFRGPCHWNTNLILNEIDKLI